MIYLRYATASQEIPLGYFVDSTDGNTEETGLTIANTDIKLWKTGASTLASKNSGGATHISNGIYYATLDDTDTNTLGSMVIFVHVSGALTVRLECCVLPTNIYDSWIAGTDYQDVNTAQVEGSDATDQIRDSVVDDSTRIDASALNTLSGHDPGSQIAAQTDVTGLNDLSSADVQSACDSAITANTDINNIDTGVNNIEAKLPSKSYLTGSNNTDGDIQMDEATGNYAGTVATVTTVGTCTTNSDMRGTDNAALASVCTEGRLSELDAANIPSDVDDILTDTGTTIPAQILGLNNISSSDITTACTSSLNTYDPPTKTELDSAIAGLNDITVADIIAGVVDGSYDLQEMIRLIFAACAGKSDGGGTDTLHFRDSGDSKNRITATVDADGNRTSVSLDGS